MSKTYRYLRIALTEAGLARGFFFVIGLPEPYMIELKDYSVQRPQSQGGQARQGYNRGLVQWDVLSQDQINILYELIAASEVTYGEGNALLWLTLPRKTGASAGQDWVDISGTVPMPEFAPLLGAGYAVTLNINAVTFENVPSNVL